MENWGSYFSNASNGSGHQKLDLTLRLGLPCQDSHVENANGENFPTQNPTHNRLEFKNLRFKDGLKTCDECGTGETPMWRKGPKGPQTLCNACGLRYIRFLKKEEELLKWSRYYRFYYQNGSWH
ncbi:hypothetical protein M9H77_06150 [Catharanthus roseus]|uniref:Uncharacterized protein n=1 Tax=Catharanthus roseus TaxID=4058 RepID=A0ACC0BR93_CATRO|nr:hypothetical protein M9H77_06150 [Catharanthus roseus]